MSVKIYQTEPASDGTFQCWFFCPGCQNHHAFTIGGPAGASPRWTWNGSLESPTFHPSLMCNRPHPESQCHSVVTDGVINFCADCHHALAGQSVPMPDWEGW